MRIRACLCLLAFCTALPALAQDGGILYEAALIEDRAETNELFRTGDDSPLPMSQREAFSGLDYFPIDESYRVEARLERTVDPVAFDLPHSRDETRRYESFGTLAFELGGESYRLEAYRRVERTDADTLLSVFFYDATNGADDPARATYKGGRYLSLPIPAPDTESVTLDFNRAYHPYCVYNSTYVCPLPPPTNRLPIPIPAGERLPLPEGDLPQGWSYFTPEEGGFRVALPGTPTRSTTQNDNGNVLINYLIDNGSHAYLVNITQFGGQITEAEQDQLFEGLKLTLAASMSGTLVSSQSITVAGYEALSLDVEIPQGEARLIAIPLGDKVVQLMTMNATPDTRETLDEAYVGSFQVLTTETKPRLARMLDATELTYEPTSDGAYRLVMWFEPDSTETLVDTLPDAAGAAPEAEERSQLVVVTESFDEMAEASYYAIVSMVYVGESEPPAGLMRAALMGGSSDELGGFTLTHEPDDDGAMIWQLYYLSVLPNTGDAGALADTLWYVASVADDLEMQWVPGDEW